MTKPLVRESPPQPNEQLICDCDGEYEFPIALHWIAPEATPFPGKTRLL
jgi:hypothetical protein